MIEKQPARRRLYNPTNDQTSEDKSRQNAKKSTEIVYAVLLALQLHHYTNQLSHKKF